MNMKQLVAFHLQPESEERVKLVLSSFFLFHLVWDSSSWIGGSFHLSHPKFDTPSQTCHKYCLIDDYRSCHVIIMGHHNLISITDFIDFDIFKCFYILSFLFVIFLARKIGQNLSTNIMVLY